MPKRLSMSELDALRRAAREPWNIPAGAKDPRELTVLDPYQAQARRHAQRSAHGADERNKPLFAAARDSAIRALFRGQPYDMLRPETYELWKDIEITFDPKEMIRG